MPGLSTLYAACIVVSKNKIIYFFISTQNRLARWLNTRIIEILDLTTYQQSRHPALKSRGEKQNWVVWTTFRVTCMFKDLQQQHVWLWTATLTFPLKSSARSGWRSTAYSNQHTEFLSPDRQYRETLSHGAGHSTAKQMNDWIEEVCSLTFTSCEGYKETHLNYTK
jgi:hypothetical protein